MSGMKADDMDVDQPGAMGGRVYAGGRERSGRTSAGSMRGIPYGVGPRSSPSEARGAHADIQRPSHPPPPPAGQGVDQKWGHDLFGDSSSIYAPVPARYDMKTRTMSAAPPNPSLRPFGTPTPPVTSEALPRPTPVPAPAPAAQPVSLLNRINIKGRAVNNSAPLADPTPAPAGPPSAPAAMRSPPAKTSASEKRERQEAERRAKKQYDTDLAKWRNGPVEVLIFNLADGTTVDDVQTAFADFGAIEQCATKRGDTVNGQATLVARIVFSKPASADKAHEALDGALADGLKLRVDIRGSINPKPIWDEYRDAALAAIVSPASSSAAPGAALAQSSGKMQSDLLASRDPRASIQSEPARQLRYDQVQIRDAERPPRTLSQRMSETMGDAPPVDARRTSGLADRIAGPGSTRATRQGNGGGLMDRMQR